MLEENSLKMIAELKSKGFVEARKVGCKSKFGLLQVAYNSYDTVEDARLALSRNKTTQHDINAWLLIKN